jgi:hypothetical protein
MEKIIVIKYQVPVFENRLDIGMEYFFENFLTIAYAIVEEVLYKDDKGTKVGCYNPITNRRILTYLESEKIDKEFNTEDAAIQYIESQHLLEKEKIEKTINELKQHIDKFLKNTLT